MQYPIVFSHIGISVPDIEKAIEFYKEVFGWYHLAGPWTIKRDGGPSSNFCDTVYGENWTGFKLAHMSTGDRIGIELLEFEGSYPAKEWEFKKHGVFHFGITVPSYEEFLKKLEAYGGKQRSLVNKRDVRGTIYAAVYAEDPFGNIFEIYTHSYEVMSKP
ncbi:VOC family protein [Moorella sulfitireducens]|uniref:VOC family protein n=1 Tax=Neomoorella sulfitireducens TaxID=2972948 RepID=UPI0021ABD001|nr:VOC family protein [Moorella sulfitireducens]